ncbi:MAG: CDP-diacylglycerol--serine O-phosphatidyltransferase [Bdellovibrionales bacterium]
MELDHIKKFSLKRRELKGVEKRRIRLRNRVPLSIYILPNLFTTANMFFGFMSVIYSIKGDYLTAAYAIVAAAAFDLFDGRVARMTNTTSHFGAEYDSLSDLISFGMAPAILMFLWALQPFGRLGWLAAFLFVACGALRLARFNVQAHIVERKDFQGLPIPMAAGIVSGSVLCFHDLGLEAYKSLPLLLMTFLLSFVMVSTFRYRSFKDLDLKERLPFRYLVTATVLLVVVALRPEVMLFVLFLTYALLGAIFGILNIGKKKTTAQVYVNTPSFEDDYTGGD